MFITRQKVVLFINNYKTFAVKHFYLGIKQLHKYTCAHGSLFYLLPVYKQPQTNNPLSLHILFSQFGLIVIKFRLSNLA